MKKNDILEALDNLGFTTDELFDNNFHFEYENSHFLYTSYDDDDVFLYLAIPGIFQMKEGMVEDIMPVVNHANRLVKYVKFLCVDDSVWVLFEYPLFDGVDLEALLQFAILLLHRAAFTFRSILCGEFDESDGEEVEV